MEKDKFFKKIKKFIIKSNNEESTKLYIIINHLMRNNDITWKTK
jgi:hypothetical protein